MSDTLQTPRTTLKRLHERGAYDRNTINAILDAGVFCHVGYVQDGQPFVTPTSYWREDNRLLIHGSSASRMVRVLAAGAPACITVTHVDDLVLARSAFHHSVNFRTVMVLGQARKIEGAADKARTLKGLIDRIAPGRWETLRPINDQELKATAVLAFDLDEASAKVRQGPPIDDEQDYPVDDAGVAPWGQTVWAGVSPLTAEAGEPIACPRQAAGVAVPGYARRSPFG